MFKFFSLILLSLSVLTNPIQKNHIRNRGKEEMRNGGKKSRADEVIEPWMRRYKFCLPRNVEESFKDLIEAEEYLKCLLKQRDILIGDFYGLNISVFRYVNIFDRMGYIRYKIMKVDEEIKKIKLEIYELSRK